MDGENETILKSLTERKYSYSLPKIKIFLGLRNQGDGRTELCMKVLKHFSVVAPLAGGESKEDVVSFLEVIRVCMAFIESTRPKDLTTERRLYSTLQLVLHFDARTAVRICVILRQSLAKKLQQGEICEMVDLAKTILCNSYLLLWNNSIAIEANASASQDEYKFINALEMRLESLKCLCIGKGDLQKFFKQALQAVQSCKTHCANSCSSDIDSYYETVCKLTITKPFDAPKDDVLNCWLHLCLSRTAFLLKHGCPKKTLEVVTAIPDTEFANHLSEALVKERRVLVTFCMKILLIAAKINLELNTQMPVNDENAVSKILQKCIKALPQLSGALSTTQNSTKMAVFVESLDLLEQQGNLLALSDKNKGRLDKRRNLLAIVKILLFRIKLLNAYNANDTGFINQELGMIHNTLHMYSRMVMESESDTESVALLTSDMSEVIAAAMRLQQCLCEVQSDGYRLSTKLNNGRVIGCIGIYFYQKMLYALAIPFLKMKLSLDLSYKSTTDWNSNLVKTLETVVFSMKKEGLLHDALHCIAQVYCISEECHSNCMVSWAGVKLMASKSNQLHINKITLKKLIESDENLKTLVSRKQMYRIQQDELEAYKTSQHDCSIDKFYVLEEMLSSSLSIENKAQILNDMVQLHWGKKNTLPSGTSADDYCDTVIDMLEKSLPINGVSILHCHLATSYLWKSILLLEKSQVLAEKRVMRSESIVPLEETSKVNGNSDETERADVTPSYLQTTINLERNYTDLLDRSLKLWTQVVTAKSNIEYPPFALSVLKTVAEMCSISGRDTKEMLAWSLAYKVAKATKSLAESAICLTKVIVTLVRLGFLNEAQAFMEESRSLFVKLNPAVIEECRGMLYLHYAESELLLMTGSVWNGWKILCSIMQNELYKANDNLAISFLRIKANILATKYSLLPPAVHIERDENMLPLDYASRAQRYALVLKDQQSKEKSFKKQFSIPENDYKIIGCLLTAAVNFAQVFQHIGAVNDSRFILKDKLLWVQKLSLASWSVKLLLLLARLDLLSGFLPDCNVKLNGIDFVVNCEGSLEACNEVFQDNPEAPSQYEIPQPKAFTRSYTARTVSIADVVQPPESIKLPEWLHFGANCNCSFCSSLTLRRLLLQYVALRAEHLLEQGHSNLALSIMKKIENVAAMTNAAAAVVHVGFGEIHKMKAFVDEKKPREAYEDEWRKPSIWSCEFLMQFATTCYVNGDSEMAIKSLKKMAGILNESNRFRGHHEKYQLMAAANYYMALLKLSKAAGSNNICELFDEVWPSSVTNPDEIDEEDELLHLVNQIDQLDIKQTPHQTYKPAIKKGASCRAPVKNLVHPSIICISDDSDGENSSYPPKQTSSKPTKIDNFPEDCPNENSSRYKTPAHKSRLTRKNKKDPEEVDLSIKNMKKNTVTTKKPVRRIIDSVSGEVKDIPNSPLREQNVIDSHKSECDDGEKIPVSQKTVSRRKLRSILKSTDTETDDSSVVQSKKKGKGKLAFKLTSSSDDSEVFVEDDIPRPMQYKRVTRQSTRSSASSVSASISYNSSSRSVSAREFLRETDSQEQEIVRAGSSPEIENSLRMMKSRVVSIPKSNATAATNKGELLSEVSNLLEDAISWIIHYPPGPLYTNLCKLLAFCSGEGNSLSSFCAAESMMCSLRHETLFSIAKKIKVSTERLNGGVDGADFCYATIYKHLQGHKMRREALKFCANIEESLMHMNELINSIPENWAVVQINAEPEVHQSLETKPMNPDLLITRYCRKKDPLMIKIRGGICNGFPKYETELKFIFEESARSFQQEDRKTWWSMRKGLDNRLKVFLESVEKSWLGPWKGLFLGKPIDVAKQKVLEKLVDSTLANWKACNEERPFMRERLEVLISASPWLEVCTLKKGLAQIMKCSQRDSIIHTACISILNEKDSLMSAGERHPVVLILDKTTQSLPWESLPILRGNSAVRMPSLHFMMGHLKIWENSLLPTGVNTKNAFYVLNPSQDLPGTQTTFQGNFNRRNWVGTSGKEPSVEICTKALTSNELFVYCGHGSGSKYFGTTGVSILQAKATALLIGCSSVRLTTQSAHLDPNGSVLRYMIAGCPCIVGNMWDITDRDIDRFLMEMLNLWTPVEKSRQEKRVDRAVSLARSVCELKYMIGSAPVVYGLPVKALAVL